MHAHGTLPLPVQGPHMPEWPLARAGGPCLPRSKQWRSTRISEGTAPSRPPRKRGRWWPQPDARHGPPGCAGPGEGVRNSQKRQTVKPPLSGCTTCGQSCVVQALQAQSGDAWQGKPETSLINNITMERLQHLYRMRWRTRPAIQACRMMTVQRMPTCYCSGLAPLITLPLPDCCCR